MMQIRLFDPTGIKPVDYKSKYPELKRTPEFESLRGTELIFVWYFANATSPIVDITDDNKRVKEALHLSALTPEPVEYENILQLNFTERMEAAIEKMGFYQPGARYYGFKSIKAIFDQYQEIAQMGTAAFKKSTGSGEEKTEEVDYNAYTNTTTKISAELPKLIARMEEGFGLTITGASEAEEEGQSLLRPWNLERQNR